MSQLNRKTQLGFSIVEVILVLVVVGIVAFAGYYVLNRDSDDQETLEQPETSQQEINNSDDLQTTEDSLNDINLDELDTTELDEAEADLL